jgi:alanine racemase
MNRGGIWWEEFAGVAPTFADAPGLEGIATHFHSAERDSASVKEQWRRFQAAIDLLPRRPEIVHAANSAAALAHPEVCGDVVRPGIYLYGGAVGAAMPAPVVSWRARLARIARTASGATVSYGATFTAEQPQWITTVAAGYADGFCRSLAERGAILIGGKRRRIAGMVTMDFTMVHSADEPKDDAVATLIGSDGGETISLDDVAQAAGTISYEILTGLGPRVERIYR